MSRKIESYFWITVFVLIFALSLDYWNWGDGVGIGWLHMPNWIYYFILLQMIFFAAFWVFSSRYWQDNES